MSIEHDAPCATTRAGAQLPVPPTIENSALLVAMVDNVTLPGPALLIETRWTADGWPTTVTPGNATAFGAAWITGTGSVVAVPASATVSAVDVAPCVTLNVDVNEPLALGANATLNVQDWPAARVTPRQFPVCVKCGPETATILMARPPPPAFVTVTGCGALLVPTC